MYSGNIKKENTQSALVGVGEGMGRFQKRLQKGATTWSGVTRRGGNWHNNKRNNSES